MINYTLNFLPTKFFIFGCGGTGSRLVPQVAQFLYTIPWLRILKPKIVIVDPDQVEAKNLERQNFVGSDIGKNKAVVLANRYSKAYGCEIIAIPEIFNLDAVSSGFDRKSPATSTYEGLYKCIQGPGISSAISSANGLFNNSIIFICVDSISARQSVFETIYKTASDPCIIIDTGNENDFGQVKLHGSKVLGDQYDDIPKYNSIPRNIPIDVDISTLPVDISYFYDMPEPAVKDSCADMDQTMAINSLVATTAFSVLQNLLFRKPISWHRMNISLGHGSYPEYLSVDYILSLNKQAKKRNGSCITDYLPMCHDIWEKLTFIYEQMKKGFPFMLKEDSTDEEGGGEEFTEQV